MTVWIIAQPSGTEARASTGRSAIPAWGSRIVSRMAARLIATAPPASGTISTMPSSSRSACRRSSSAPMPRISSPVSAR